MCYEFESWHWKARAKDLLQKAQPKASASEKSAPAKPAQETARKHPEVKESEKVPV